MVTIGYVAPGKKYGVLVCDLLGNPIQDRQRCANTISEAIAIAKKDLQEVRDNPFGCAAVYKTVKNMALAVRFIDSTGRITKPTQDEEV